MEEEVLAQIASSLIKGQAPRVQELVQSCLDQGVAPETIMDQGLVSAMSLIGRRFKKGEIYMPEVMIAARAMNAGLAILDPVLSQSDVEPRGRLLLGTVRADLHDVGKNMVSMMFRGAGFEVIDLGVDVPEARFVEAMTEHSLDVVGLSALLTMTIPQLKSTIEAIVAAGLRDRAIVMVGGAPVTEAYALEIGADGWAPDAASAVDRALELMASRR
ncbi:MAG: corrinoid protein [Proteobacteria bacterium]|nr:corrinoid protein [Pseudomonadota bacterium]MBU1742485.1 corrinoid protein [Pseudomonadota bacterium]